MNKNQDQPADAAELCRRAEQRLSEKQKSQRSEGGDKRPAEDAARLVHELQVHQIELEMQNEELRQARAKADGLLVQYTDLYDFAPTGYMSLDREGAIRQVNLTGARLFGVERSRLVKRRLGLFLAESRRRAFRDFLERVFASQAKECCEVTLLEEGSQPLVMRIEGTRSADGQECRAVVLDITERKRAEEALRESEERYRRLFEEAPVAYHEIDRQGIMVRVNRAECELLGYPPEEILGRPVWDFVASEQREAVEAVVRKKMLAPYLPVVFEREWMRRDGSRLTVEIHENLILDAQGEVTAIRAALLDVTQRKWAEEGLRKSLRRFELLTAAAADLLVIADPQEFVEALCRRVMEHLDCHVFFNFLADERAGRLHLNAYAGIPDEEARRIEWLDYGVAVCGIAAREGCRIVAENIQTTPDPLTELVKSYGIRAYACHPLQVAEGKVIGTLSFGARNRDKLSDDDLSLMKAVADQVAGAMIRAKAHEKLRDSETLNRSLVQHFPHVIFLKDRNSVYITCNANYARDRGIEPERIAGKDDFAFYPRELAEAYRADDQAVMDGGTLKEVEERYVVADEERWVHTIKVPYLDAQGRVCGVLGIFEDITDRKRAEADREKLQAQFIQSQKMESVGRLAGGVAHDFNNLLMVIQGYGDLLLEKLEPGDVRRRAAEEISKAAQRASGLTRQLLAFSRKQVLQPRVLDLGAVVTNIEKMLRRLIGEDVELRTVLDPALGRIKADPGQIEQVLMNLAVNARDAMPHGGKLTIETANVDVDEDYARQHGGVQPGPYVRLSVSDTGCGMDAETRAHIFEPFFTTKERGKGTGLGLPTVYGIVKQSGGYIWAYSEVERGTVFKIYLPRASGSAEVRQQGEVQQTLPGGVETVLVAEDDPAVRALVCGALASRGYTVQEARDGREALAAARGYKGPIHLLLTDVVLPHMSGRRLAERLRAERPESRLLYMSGYTDDAVVSHGVSAGNVPFLQKPFSASALSRKVREVLDQPSPRAGRRRRRPQ